ncbi:hypothetical protein GCM10010416_38610 [Streptomyces caniferus]
MTISQRWGALTNRTRRAILGTRRRSDPGFEAWIADEEGSIGVRHWRRAFGRRRAMGVEKNNEVLLRLEDMTSRREKIGITALNRSPETRSGHQCAKWLH